MQQRNRENGQVLLLGVIALLILLVAVFLLFDIQSAIRFKIKAQNGVDAAALVGARWQMHTLNCIGELNLIKASSLLLSEDIFRENAALSSAEEYLKVAQPENFDTVDIEQRYGTLKAAAAALSQMQYRLLFIGPLIGFAAAQQAAKNNGIESNPKMGEAMIEQLTMLEGHGEYSDIYSRYKEDDFVRKELYGFQWYAPYISMLNTILEREDDQASGIAVLPSGKLLSTPRLYTEPKANPDFSGELSSRYFFSAVEANQWCWLISFLDKSENISSAKWWGNLKVDMDSTFRGESEFLPVGVKIASATSSIFDHQLVDSNYYDTIVKKRELNQTLLKGGQSSIQDWQEPYFRRKDGTYQKNPNDTDSMLNPLPVIDWAFYKTDPSEDNYWLDYSDNILSVWKEYLKTDFRPEAAYHSGAVARMDAYSGQKMIVSTLGSSSSNGTTNYLMDGLDRGGAIFSDSSRTRRAMDRHRSAQNAMRNSSIYMHTNTLAKPFGKLSVDDVDEPPHHSKIVLPVFDKTAIIPMSLEDPGANPLVDYDWYRFLIYYLPELGKVSAVSDISDKLKSEFSYWHNLIASKLDNSEWHQTGLVWLNGLNTIQCNKLDLDNTLDRLKSTGHHALVVSPFSETHSIISWKNRDDCKVSGGTSTNPIILH